MDEPAETSAPEAQANETLSMTELQFEREKLKLEHDRILLERERLNAARERLEGESHLHANRNGKFTVTLSTLIMATTISALVGGILGAATNNMTNSIHRTARLREVVNQLAVNEGMTVTNAPAGASSNNIPAWLKSMKPRGAHPDIAVVVVQ